MKSNGLSGMMTAIKNKTNLGGDIDVTCPPISTERMLETEDREVFRAAVYQFVKERIDAGAYDEVFDMFYKGFIAKQALIFNLTIEFGDNDRSFMKCLLDQTKRKKDQGQRLIERGLVDGCSE